MPTEECLRGFYGQYSRVFVQFQKSMMPTCYVWVNLKITKLSLKVNCRISIVFIPCFGILEILPFFIGGVQKESLWRSRPGGEQNHTFVNVKVICQSSCRRPDNVNN